MSIFTIIRRHNISLSIKQKLESRCDIHWKGNLPTAQCPLKTSGCHFHLIDREQTRWQSRKPRTAWGGQSGKIYEWGDEGCSVEGRGISLLKSRLSQRQWMAKGDNRSTLICPRPSEHNNTDILRLTCCTGTEDDLLSDSDPIRAYFCCLIIISACNHWNYRLQQQLQSAERMPLWHGQRTILTKPQGQGLTRMSLYMQRNTLYAFRHNLSDVWFSMRNLFGTPFAFDRLLANPC